MRLLTLFLTIGLCLSLHMLYAQAKNRLVPKGKEDWHMLDLKQDSVWGASINKAYEFLRAHGYQEKKKTIVAVIDSGYDEDHEDLKEQLWTNIGEIPGNGIDDDRNGFVDDVHGWNFIGKLNGEQVELVPMENLREFLRFYEKYLDADTTLFSKKELKEYRYFIREVCPTSGLYARYRIMKNISNYTPYISDFGKLIQESFPDSVINVRIEYKVQNLIRKEGSVEKKAAYEFFLGLMKGKSSRDWPAIVERKEQWQSEAKQQFINNCQENIDKQEKQWNESGNRIWDFKQCCGYGNPHFDAKSALHGTHVSGIIGANRNNNIGIKGIAEVQIMPLRILGVHGDEQDKDIASAIRYAVDNGAKIINMSFAKKLSAKQDEVMKAFQYAAKKGVILVKAAGNDALNTDSVNVYPQKRFDPKKSMNLINVGSIDFMGNPSSFSNYGKIEVDIFAQGSDIYSAIPDNKYQALSGTSMASPVVAGIAALVWNHFPELSARDVIEIIYQSGISRENILVPKPQVLSANIKKNEESKATFDQISATGKIINAHEAVKLAHERLLKKRK